MTGIVFSGQVNVLLNIVSDESFKNLIKNGAAYGSAASDGGLNIMIGQDTLSHVIRVCESIIT